MDAQRVKVLHVTYCNTIVVTVANNLILNLFPTFETLLYQHLWRERECLLGKLVKLLLVIGKT